MTKMSQKVAQKYGLVFKETGWGLKRPYFIFLISWETFWDSSQIEDTKLK